MYCETILAVVFSVICVYANGLNGGRLVREFDGTHGCSWTERAETNRSREIVEVLRGCNSPFKIYTYVSIQGTAQISLYTVNNSLSKRCKQKAQTPVSQISSTVHIHVP
jgi:hypothetical protein